MMLPNVSNVGILINADLTEAAASPVVGEEQRQRMQTWLKVVTPTEKRLQTFHHLGRWPVKKWKSCSAPKGPTVIYSCGGKDGKHTL